MGAWLQSYFLNLFTWFLPHFLFGSKCNLSKFQSYPAAQVDPAPKMFPPTKRGQKTSGGTDGEGHSPVAGRIHACTGRHFAVSESWKKPSLDPPVNPNKYLEYIHF